MSDDNHTVRVIVDINVPSELERDLLMSNTEFQQMAGMAVQAVASTVAKVSADSKWNNGKGFYTQVHQHFSSSRKTCNQCSGGLAEDEINVPVLS